MAPELIAGDPISFAELLTLPMAHKPAALLSVSMMLLPGMRARLEAAFGCPVLDIYSLNEVGPVAVYDEQAGGHVLLQHRLYVEILDSAGQPVPDGARGEITVTGGFNFACRWFATARVITLRWRMARTVPCWWAWPAAVPCATGRSMANGSTISTLRMP